MLSQLEQRLVERLVPSTGVIVEVGRAPSAAMEAVRRIRPKVTHHLLAPGGAVNVAGVRRIHFLNVAADGPGRGVLDSLRTAVTALRERRIDLVRFEYGPAIREAGESLFDISVFLTPFGFGFLGIKGEAGQRIARIVPGMDNYEPATFYAVSARLMPLLVEGQQPDLRGVVPAQFQRFNLPRRGVVHVGAHEGEELEIYRQMGFERVLFVEANPTLAEKLRQATAGDPRVTVVHAAAAAHDGEATLHITSMDQSSSILPLKIHSDLYPTITESSQVTVPARRLDTLIGEAGFSPEDFNYLHLDIQGAEYLALKGAPNLLKKIDALTSEINFEELYAGCTLFDDLNELLGGYGFEPQVVNCPYSVSWGDAFYLRSSLAFPHKKQAGDPAAPVIAMSTLGTNGRYGNHLFQYTFLRVMAAQHNLRVETSPWIGQQLFGHKDPPVTQRFHPIYEGRDIPDGVFPSALLQMPPANCEFWGYFQCDMVHYAPFKELIRSVFQPAPGIRDQLVPALERLAAGRELVALHLRRGDYKETGLFFAAPEAWYQEWLRAIWPTLKNPLLYIASDEPDKVLPAFADYSPVTARELGARIDVAPYYPDFWVLSQAEHVATSNSSFSFFATLLNERGRTFVRPNQLLKRLVSYDPWNAAPLLHRDMGTPIPHPPAPPPPVPVPPPVPGASTVQQVGRTASGARIISFKKPS